MRRPRLVSRKDVLLCVCSFCFAVLLVGHGPLSLRICDCSNRVYNEDSSSLSSSLSSSGKSRDNAIVKTFLERSETSVEKAAASTLEKRSASVKDGDASVFFSAMTSSPDSMTSSLSSLTSLPPFFISVSDDSTPTTNKSSSINSSLSTSSSSSSSSSSSPLTIVIDSSSSSTSQEISKSITTFSTSSSTIKTSSTTSTSFSTLSTSSTSTTSSTPTTPSTISTSTTLPPSRQIRPLSCVKCHPHDFPLSIDIPEFCDDDGSSVFLLLTVHSRPESAAARLAIRETWGNLTKYNVTSSSFSPSSSFTSSSVKRVFLVGRSKDSSVDEAIEEESRVFNDILREDFRDSYYNLTYKAVMGLKWATTRCGAAHFLIRVDDDVFLNVDNLVRYLKGRPDLQVGGRVYRGKQRKVSRDPTSKWYVTPEQYPYPFYPTYLPGTLQVFSMSAAKKIYLTSPDVPFFLIDDVYITGFVANMRLGLPLFDIPHVHNTELAVDVCHFKNELISSHGIFGDELRRVWRDMRRTNCSRGDGSGERSGNRNGRSKKSGAGRGAVVRTRLDAGSRTIPSVGRRDENVGGKSDGISRSSVDDSKQRIRSADKEGTTSKAYVAKSPEAAPPEMKKAPGEKPMTPGGKPMPSETKRSERDDKRQMWGVVG